VWGLGFSFGISLGSSSSIQPCNPLSWRAISFFSGVLKIKYDTMMDARIVEYRLNKKMYFCIMGDAGINPCKYIITKESTGKTNKHIVPNDHLYFFCASFNASLATCLLVWRSSGKMYFARWYMFLLDEAGRFRLAEWLRFF